MAKRRVQPMMRNDQEVWLLRLMAQSSTLSFSAALEEVIDTHPMFIRHREKIESDENYEKETVKLSKRGAKIRAANKRR